MGPPPQRLFPQCRPCSVKQVGADIHTVLCMSTRIFVGLWGRPGRRSVPLWISQEQCSAHQWWCVQPGSTAEGFHVDRNLSIARHRNSATVIQPVVAGWGGEGWRAHAGVAQPRPPAAPRSPPGRCAHANSFCPLGTSAGHCVWNLSMLGLSPRYIGCGTSVYCFWECSTLHLKIGTQCAMFTRCRLFDEQSRLIGTPSVAPNKQLLTCQTCRPWVCSMSTGKALLYEWRQRGMVSHT